MHDVLRRDVKDLLDNEKNVDLEHRVINLEVIVNVLCKIHMDHNACMQFLQKQKEKRRAEAMQEDRDLAKEARRLRFNEIADRRKQKLKD